MQKILIFDPFAGISGDMTVAALLDLGLGEEWLRDFVASLGLPGTGVEVRRVNRRGISALHILFSYPEERTHRHLRHVLEIIERSTAPTRAKELAVDIFGRIAEAEAHIHGTTVENVHFHEVGAMDAILDVLCTAAGVVELGFESFRTRPVAVGSGWIDIEHGRYPVPAPATLRILEGMPLTGLELHGECTTPTGAAIVAALTGGAPAPAAFVAGRTGFGAGTRDPQDRPNVLRVMEAVETGVPSAMYVVQADVDDMPPEYTAAAQEALMDAGAADVIVSGVAMKKGRPGMRVEALVPSERLEAVERALFLATSTIGVRRWPVERSVLSRRTEERSWRGQTIRWKQVVLPDGSAREKPEYEDVVKAAAALGMAPWQVRVELEAWRRDDTNGGAAV